MRKMKDSGIEWIGEIPEDWTMKRIGSLYAERRIKVSDTKYPPLSVTKKGILPQLDTVAKTDAHDDRKLVLNGDFVINSRSDRRGSCGISDLDGSVSLINTVLIPKVKLEKGYYRWLFSSVLFADEFYKWGHGIVDDLWTTNWNDMKSISIPNPSTEEQEAIATYLDHKCSEIDSIVRNTEQTIEEYKKLKQSLITEIVTGKKRVAADGVSLSDEPRKMKESGVEWIGEVPEEWEIRRFKDIATVKANLVHPTDYQDYLQIAPDNIEKGSAKLLPCKTVKESNIISDNHLFKKGQIIYSKIRPTLNKLVIAPFDGLCSADMYPIETTNHIDYMKYSMLSDMFVAQVDVVVHDRVKMPKINQNELSILYFTVPSINEQQIIAAYLDTRCSEIDKLIADKQTLLQELESYKKSLIYECVTGKREIK